MEPHWHEKRSAAPGWHALPPVQSFAAGSQSWISSALQLGAQTALETEPFCVVAQQISHLPRAAQSAVSSQYTA